MTETIKLDDMRVFWEVARQGSFTAAGTALGMPKQTVSRRVAELEGALGRQLLFRTTRAVRLTDAGRLYADHCEELVRVAEAATSAVLGEQPGEPRGRLRISADPHFAEHFLVELLHGYSRDFPEVVVELVATERVVNMVEEGFDLAVRIGRLEDSANLVAKRLAKAEICYVAATTYLDERGRPGSIDDLGLHDVVAGPQNGSSPRWPFLVDGNVRMVPVQPRLIINRQEVVQQLVLAGAGIGLFPRFAAEPHVDRGELEVVLDGQTPPVGDIWVVFHRSRHVPPKVRQFVDRLEDAMGV